MAQGSTSSEPQSSSRLDYRRNLYVGRESEIAIAVEWYRRDNPKRLLTITGPPASGKTWFLKRLQAEFDGAQPCVIEVDVRELLTYPTNQQINAGQFSQQKAMAWIAELAEKMRLWCPTLRVPEPTADISAVLTAIAQDLCARCCPADRIYFFLDGGDEPIKDSWRDIERQIIEPLARADCARFVIALRENQRLQAVPLRWYEQRLQLKPLSKGQDQVSEKGREQINALLDYWKREVTAEDMLGFLPGYTWDHPGLNYFIADELKRQDFKGLGAGYLWRGLNSLSVLPGDQAEAIMSLLSIVVELRREWIIDDVVEALGTSTAETWRRIQLLQEYWLVTSATDSRFKIVDGVREFVHAAKADTANSNWEGERDSS